MALRLPRAKPLDAQRVLRHTDALSRFPGSIATYCRARELRVDALVQAIQREAPLWWAMYAAAHPETVATTCPNCGRAFYASKANQKLCSRICGAQRRADVTYFDGQRRSATGFPERECQLCRQRNPPGLSVHHVIGKGRDPRNEHLVALCKGCHLVVGMLANRRFVDDVAGWQSLIAFVLLRRSAGRVVAIDVDVEIIQHRTVAAAAPQGEIVHA